MLHTGEIFDSRFRLKKPLGSGGFSEVWLADDLNNNSLEVALKIYGVNHALTEVDISVFIKQFQLVHSLKHSNLLIPKTYGQYGSMPYLVLPYCPNGSSEQLIGKMTEKEAWKYLRDVSEGLTFLHRSDVIHLDIKPDNVMISPTGEYAITDFDVSAESCRSIGLGFNRLAGTPTYMAPERFCDTSTCQHDSVSLPVMASDIWSLGASLYELVCGVPPFGELGGFNQKSGAPMPAVKAHVSDELKNIITRCLQKETWQRPSAHELAVKCRMKAEHPVFQLDSYAIRKYLMIAAAVTFVALVITAAFSLKPTDNKYFTADIENPYENTEIGVAVANEPYVVPDSVLFERAREKAISLFCDEKYDNALRYCLNALKFKPQDVGMLTMKEDIETIYAARVKDPKLLAEAKQPESKPETPIEQQPETKAETKAETKVEAKAEPKVETPKVETKAETPKVETKAEPKAEANKKKQKETKKNRSKSVSTDQQRPIIASSSRSITKPSSSEIFSSREREEADEQKQPTYFPPSTPPLWNESEVIKYNGKAVGHGNEQAIETFRRCARNGDSDCQSSLGWIYAKGMGVKKDYAEAYELFSKSAAQNNPRGENNLGVMYELGLGVQKNYSKALEYYRRSAGKGLPEGIHNLSRLKESRNEIAFTQ